MDSATRPEIIVHMMSSVDGRILPRRWSPFERGTHYEDVHDALAGDAWMCGRITMQGYTRGDPADDRDPTPLPRIDHVACEHGPYAIALDFSGRLHWGPRHEIEGDHVVVALSEAVTDAHLNALRAAGISYLFCGHDGLDLPLLCDKLRDKLNIRRLIVEGGGAINGAFLQARLVDQISLLLAPTVDGGRGTPAVFDFDRVEGSEPARHVSLSLAGCEQRAGGIVWLRYRASWSEIPPTS